MVAFALLGAVELTEVGVVLIHKITGRLSFGGDAHMLICSDSQEPSLHLHFDAHMHMGMSWSLHIQSIVVLGFQNSSVARTTLSSYGQY